MSHTDRDGTRSLAPVGTTRSQASDEDDGLVGFVFPHRTAVLLEIVEGSRPASGPAGDRDEPARALAGPRSTRALPDDTVGEVA